MADVMNITTERLSKLSSVTPKLKNNF